MKRFENRVAIVTGAGAGIGKHCALRLSSEGASVMICDINRENLEITANEIKEAGGICEMSVFDLMNSDAIYDTVKKTYFPRGCGGASRLAWQSYGGNL